MPNTKLPINYKSEEEKLQNSFKYIDPANIEIHQKEVLNHRLALCQASPHPALQFLHLGTQLFYQHCPNEALTYFHKFHQLSKGTWFTKYLHGCILDALKKTDDAMHSFYNLIQTYPEAIKQNMPTLYQLFCFFSKNSQQEYAYWCLSMLENLIEKKFNCLIFRDTNFLKFDKTRREITHIELVGGPGDQLRNLSIVSSMIDRSNIVNIICDSRLWPIISNDFPKASLSDLTTQKCTSEKYSKISGFNAIRFIEVCSTSGMILGNDFKKKEKLLEKKSLFINKLPQKNNKKNIAISWRSNLLDERRWAAHISVQKIAQHIEKSDFIPIILQEKLSQNERKLLQPIIDRKEGIFISDYFDTYNDLVALTAILTSIDAVICTGLSLRDFCGVLGVKCYSMSISPWAIDRWRSNKNGVDRTYPSIKHFNLHDYESVPSVVNAAFTAIAQ